MNRTIRWALSCLSAALFVAVGVPASASAAPPAGPCAELDRETVEVDQDVDGRFLRYYVKYQCPNPVQYDITVGVDRITPDGAVFIDAANNIGGANANPFIDGRSVFCENANPTRYVVELGVVINFSERAVFSVDTTLPCFLSGPDATRGPAGSVI